MKILLPLIAVLGLIALAFAGAKTYLFAVIIPYAAVLFFISGFVLKVLKWGSSPVPFRIPTTCGQQKSLPWIKQNKIENPSGPLGVVARMGLEIFFFRSLFRNIKSEFRDGKLVYGSDKWLWMAGLAFHWSFLIIFVRHFRLFLQQVPLPIQIVERLDSLFQIGAPLFYITDGVILAALTFLVLRRLYLPQVRYISLAADYFPLLLIFAIATTGILMRYFLRTDLISIKQLTIGLVTFNPPDSTVLQSIRPIFYIHLFLISSLLAYFPLSKLMHMGGVFMSPTRNMANTSREKRHINPWNYPVHVHTYEEYENDFREKMKNAGIPVEKE